MSGIQPATHLCEKDPSGRQPVVDDIATGSQEENRPESRDKSPYSPDTGQDPEADEGGGEGEQSQGGRHSCPIEGERLRRGPRTPGSDGRTEKSQEERESTPQGSEPVG